MTRSVTVEVPADAASVDHVQYFAQMLRRRGVGAGVIVLMRPEGIPDAVMADAVRQMQNFLETEADAQIAAAATRSN